MGILEEWLTLYLTPGLGAAGCKRLIDKFGGPGEVLRAALKKRLHLPAISKKVLGAIGLPETRDLARRELDRTEKAGISLLCWDDSDFPDWLKNIPDPPVLLYIKGEKEVLAKPGISIVGSRAASTYGLRMAETLAYQLATAGFTVISGLALGIDAAAHRGALAAKGLTIAVLGCGLDIRYPAQNRDLFADIPENGAIISEYPLGTPPDGFRFPARNRIISGLGLGVLVVEATNRSGSLITAELALDQGREVFAVPGQADSLKSEGTHRLLQSGAKLVLNVNDIVNEVAAALKPGTLTATDNYGESGKEREKLSKEEQIVLEELEVYPKNVDDVIVGSGLPVEKVNELLLMLELKGFCEVLPGQQYQIKNQ